MTVVTGTPETRTRHSQLGGTLAVLTAMGIPAGLCIISLAIHGWTAISWVGALVWGGAATVVLTVAMSVGKQMGMTRLDSLELLGSTVAQPDTRHARVLGGIIRLSTGAMLAVAWAYTMELFNWEAYWLTGLFWGALLWGLAALMMTGIGVVHPSIRRGNHPDPGPAATNYGKMTPLSSLVGYLLYGLTIGLFYNWFPLM